MTQKANLVFGLEDICGILVRCTKCKGAVVISLKESQSPPEEHCPCCGETWTGNGARLEEFKFVASIKSLARKKKEDAALEILFELCYPDF